MTHDSISLTGVAGFGYHGVLAEERDKGQRFVTDVEIRLDLSGAAEGDDLAQTVDYGAVAHDVLTVVEGEPCRLIETVAQRIAVRVLANEIVDSVKVTVHKPEAPIDVPFADVSVTVERHR